ncbi:coiled-coil domain-containing protein [Providencia manganoxydans]
MIAENNAISDSNKKAIKELKSLVGTQKKEIDGLKDSLTKSTESYNLKNKELKDAKVELTFYKNKLSKAEKESSEKINEFKKMIADAQKVVKTLRKECDEAKESNTNLTADINAKQKELNEKTSTLNGLRKINKELNVKIDTLNVKYDSLSVKFDSYKAKYDSLFMNITRVVNEADDRSDSTLSNLAESMSSMLSVSPGISYMEIVKEGINHIANFTLIDKNIV